MHTQIMTFYRACDAYLQSKGFCDDPQALMTTAEVMLTALVAAFFFANNLRLAQQALKESGLVARMLSESRFNRRWHKITTDDWQGLLNLLAEEHPQDTYIVDSCPFPVCHNRRAGRSRLYQDEGNAYWGYCAAKEEYYYGLKAHVIVTATGRPVEVLLLCGCSGDLTGLREMILNLPAGAQLYADKAYTDYEYEASLLTDKQLTFLPIRKRVHKRQYAPEVTKRICKGRKRIETTFSQVTARLPRRLHAVRQAGFESKIMALFVAFAIGCAENERLEKQKLADERRVAS